MRREFTMQLFAPIGGSLHLHKCTYCKATYRCTDTALNDSLDPKPCPFCDRKTRPLEPKPITLLRNLVLGT